MAPAGVALTIDIDWAPDVLIQDTIDLCTEHSVPATVFSTHDDGISLGGEHERAIHPNFFGEDDDSAVLSALAEKYPEARGVRSHGLYTYTNLRTEYEQLGLSYESNYLMFGQQGVDPYWMHGDVIQFPIYFMDDMWMRRGSPAMDNWGDCETVRVLAFHPIHIYLNTPTIDYYQQHKDGYQEPSYLRDNRYEGRGVRDLFIDILSTLDDVRTETLGTYEDEIRATDRTV